MERIEKIICIDDSRSHRNGLLPFVLNERNIQDVKPREDVNGNYGQYVCDFGIFDKEGKETARLKYLDVMRNYNFVQECFRNAVYTKAITITEKNITKIDCDDDKIVESSDTKDIIVFTENFSGFSSIRRYDYIPLDVNFFTKGEHGYTFVEPREYSIISAIPKDELSEEQKCFLEKIDNIKNIKKNECCVLLPNYDEVIAIDNWWNDWWGWVEQKYLGKSWEQVVFDMNYSIPNDLFKFCEDMDKYVLGIIEVTGNFNGSKVPPYVYYTNVYDLRKWFVSNSAATVSAIGNPTKENEKLIQEWEDRGGGDFYNFLMVSAIPLSITSSSLNKGFKYVPPTLDLDIIINSEMEYDTLYSAYEYSYDADIDEIISAVTPYEVSSENETGSALKPTWVECTSAYCESQLESLIHPSSIMVSDDIFGVYKVFDEENPEQGKMFKCTYTSGWSSQPEIFSEHKVVTTIKRKDEYDNLLFVSASTKRDYNGKSMVYPTTKAYQVFDIKEVDVSGGTITKETIDTNPSIDGAEYTYVDEYWTSGMTWYKYVWWDCVEVDETKAKSLKCANGQHIKPGNEEYYRSVTIVSCTPSIIGETTPNIGSSYYILARYDNGSLVNGVIYPYSKINTLSIPYVSGAVLNIMSHSGDTISYDEIFSISGDTDKITIKYGKGLTSGDTKTGVHYEETLSYQPNLRDMVAIDGVYLGELFYEKIGDGLEVEEVYSEEYRQTRKVRRAKITGMEVGSIWTASGAVNAMLFTKEGSDGLQEEPKYDISLLYNRGNAAAWESHFKLSECNTLEDLENYGNNFFNL
jgi:hypothetical protein